MTDTYALMRVLCESKPVQRAAKRSAWRPPSDTQLDLEASLTRAIKTFIGSAKLTRSGVTMPDEAAHDKLLDTITRCLEQAVQEGKRVATGKHERGIISAAKNVAGRAVQLISDIVDTLASKARDIIESLFGGDESEATLDEAEAELEQWAESYAEGVADFEIHAAVEQSILNEMRTQDVEAVNIINQPDACKLCVEKAAEGPVIIKNGVPPVGKVPPFHPRCKCNTEAA